jgi:uncharacterized membrane protein YdbT with pleckstrin-like domain
MADYKESLLAGGERIVLSRRQHWITFVDQAKWAILGAVGAIVLLLLRSGMDDGFLRTAVGWIALALLVAALVWIPWQYLRWLNLEYILTNRRVIQLSGVLNKRASDSSLEKINDAILSVSMLGRALGFGDLEIQTASESGIERMHLLVDAPGFKRGMLDAKHELELELSGGNQPGPALRATPEAQPADAVPSMAPPATAPAAYSPAPMSPEDVTNAIERLSALRTSGAITAEEFEAKKADLLKRL